MKRWILRASILACICVATLVYGYWRASTRAFIQLTLIDASNKAQPVLGATLVLRDSTGKVLARGTSDARFGIVRFAHPHFGSCEDEEKIASTSSDGRSRWDRCIGEQFKWQANLAPHVRNMDVEFSQCQKANLPVALRRRADEWWLWWVPLPHIGGDPLTTYSASVSVNADRCEFSMNE